MTDAFDEPSLRSLAKRIRVQTLQFKTVTDLFGQWMKAAVLGVQVCVLVVGDSGVGKTVIAKAICEKYGACRDEHGRTAPVIFVQTPENPSSIALIEGMLESLGDPRPGSGNKRAKLRRLLMMLKEQGVLFIIMDDVQQLVDTKREWLIYDASECLKTIIKMSAVSFIGFGLPEATLLTRLNEQWERLNQGTIRIERFDWLNTASKTEFKRALKSFQNKLSMFEFPEMSSEVMALRFYLATGGLIDYVAKILLQATWNAIDEKRSKIGLVELQRAWQGAVCQNQDLGYQPFTMPIHKGQDFGTEISRAKLLVMHKPRQVPLSRVRKATHLAGIGLK